MNYTLKDNKELTTKERSIVVKEWLRRRFLDLDRELGAFTYNQVDFSHGGCTANVSFIDHRDQMLYVANAGDARCLLANRNSKEFSQVTKDHSPDVIEEY